jgi:hypothetical protein
LWPDRSIHPQYQPTGIPVLPELAKDDDIDAVMAITVPTALGRLTPAILDTAIAKPIAAATLTSRSPATAAAHQARRVSADERMRVPILV